MALEIFKPSTINISKYDVPVRHCNTCGILYQGYWCPRCGIEKTLKLRQKLSEKKDGELKCVSVPQ